MEKCTQIGKRREEKRICSLKQFTGSQREKQCASEGSTSRKPRAEDQVTGCNTEADQP